VKAVVDQRVRGVRSLKFFTPTLLLLQLNILPQLNILYAPTPKHFKFLDSYSCLNSKVNYLKAVAIDTPVDIEIWKLIHTPPVT